MRNVNEVRKKKNIDLTIALHRSTCLINGKLVTRNGWRIIQGSCGFPQNLLKILSDLGPMHLFESMCARERC